MSRAAGPPLRDSRLPAKIAGYRLGGYVGRGSMAAVYRAWDERLHRQVALKVLAPELAGDAAFRTRVIQESRAAAAVDHPHIIPVYEAGEADGTLYVAMRYASGGDARSLLTRLGPLPLGCAWRLIAEIASALDAAHAHGLIHCDVRPANILLDASDTAGASGAGDHRFGHAYLSDFGMSKAFSPGQVIQTGEFPGALDYVAPERIEGRVLDGRADLYSLACAGFELLCGTPPFGQDKGPTLMYAQLYAPPPSAAATRADMPAAVDAVLATALAKDPADRYPSCVQFAEELRSALGPGPGPAPGPRLGRAAADSKVAAAEEPAEPDRPDPEPAQRPHVLRLVLAAAAVAVVAAAIAFGFALSSPSPGRAAGSLPPAPSRAVSPGSSPAPSSAPATMTASKQAAAVSTVLASSATTRTALRAAVRQAGACTNLSTAVTQLQNVVNQRAAEARQASALPTAALLNGTAVKSGLVSALSTSLQADRDYLTWAQRLQARGCTPSDRSGAYRRALGASQVANAAKQAFVQVWNPVAAKYGIKPIVPDSF